MILFPLISCLSSLIDPDMVSFLARLKVRFRAELLIAFFADSIIAICGENPSIYRFGGQISGQFWTFFDIMQK